MPEDTFEMRLVIARTYRGYRSAAAAGMAVGVSRQTWIDWETGKSPGARKPAMLAYIANQLGVDEKWLREGGPLKAAPTDDGGGGANVVRHQGLEPRTRCYEGSVIDLWKPTFTELPSFFPETAGQELKVA